MNVPFVDLSRQHEPLRRDIDAAIARVIDSGQFINGPDVAAFEGELAALMGGRRAIGVSSGTDALLISLMALEVGPGDEVVTTPFSFFATAGAIARLGARPVFADIEPATFNLDPDRALAACTPRARAIVPVHLFGRPATLPASGKVSVIEDAAQSIGASPLAGLVATLSFFPTKNLGAMGDAGAVISGDDAFADCVASLRNHGASTKYFHERVGGNFRLDTLQAAILRVKLRHLDAWTAARRENARRYRQLFETATVAAELVVPEHHPAHVYNQFVIRAPRRDALRDHLTAAGIGTVIYYPHPLHLQACFEDLGHRKGDFPEAERACGEALALPIHPGFTKDQQEYVVGRIHEFYG